MTPARILDTRATTGPTGGQPIGPASRLDLPVLGSGGVPATGVSAVVLNLTGTCTTATTYLTAWPAGEARPTASSLNLVAGQTAASTVVVGVGAGVGTPARGGVSIYNDAGTTQVIADVVGYYPTSGAVTAPPATSSAYHPLAPVRIFDSRDDGKRLATGDTRTVQVTGANTVPAGATAVVVNVTSINPTGEGYFAVYPAAGRGRTPPASTSGRVPTCPTGW